MGAQGLPALVHWRGHGRDGVHGGGEQHERPRLGVPAVPGRHGRGGGRVRWLIRCCSSRKSLQLGIEVRARANTEGRPLHSVSSSCGWCPAKEAKLRQLSLAFGSMASLLLAATLAV